MIIVEYEVRCYRLNGHKTKYFVSNYGEVYSSHKSHKKRNVKLFFKGKFINVTKLATTADKIDGYVRIVVSYKGKRYTKKLHRMVLETFLDNTENKPEVNHIDGNKENNRLDNLEWCTRLENRRHALRMGLAQATPSGDECWNSKLCEKQVIDICEMLQDNNYTYDEIIDIIGTPCSRDMISDIKRRKTWKNISKDYTFPSKEESHYKYKKINTDISTRICELLDTNKYTIKQILAIIGEPCTYDCIAEIKKGNSWTHISSNYHFIKNKA